MFCGAWYTLPMAEDQSLNSESSFGSDLAGKPISPELEKLIAGLSVLQKEEWNARINRDKELVTLSDSDGEDYLKMQVGLLFEGLPHELRRQAEELCQDLYKRRPAFNNAEIYRYIRIFVKTLRRAYLDPRVYLQAFNRRYIEEKLFDYIAEVISRDDVFDEDLSGVARIHIDMRGLFALNELAGREMGNKALIRFIDMIKLGTTTEWLHSLGFEIITSAEHRDQFGVLVFGKTSLRPYIAEIISRYILEAESINCRDLIGLAHPAVLEKIKLMGFGGYIAKDETFHLSANVGVCLFAEVVEHAKFELSDGASYATVIQGLKARMFTIADKRVRVNQSEQRERLEKENPLRALLYSRMDHDLIELESSLIQKERQLKALEKQIERNAILPEEN